MKNINKVLDELSDGKTMTHEEYFALKKAVGYRTPKSIVIGKRDTAYRMSRKCPSCGYHFDRMDIGSKFCPSCGQKLKGNK